MPTPITGTLSVTEQADRYSGQPPPPAGRLTQTETDTLTASGTVLVSGVLTVTESGDTPASFGLLTINPIPDQSVTTGFSVQGSFAVIPSFTYADDAGPDVIFPAGSSTPITPATNWAFDEASLSAGVHTITVTETTTGATVTVPVDVLAQPVVTGSLGLTEDPDVLVSGAIAAALANLTATEANDALTAIGEVLVAGTLTVTEAADTLLSAAFLGSAGLTVTEAPDTLVAAGKVPIVGTLSLIEQSDAYNPPQVPKRQRGSPIGYRRGVLPILPGGAEMFAQRQFDQLNATISDLILMTPQAATKEPSQLRDGMRRLARNPWRPVHGQAADAWVYWDAASQQWRFESDTPINT